tara:strand:- start:101 stop:1780 length:1680 start_codon:yes stop_codon:yes gene_type:complete
MGISVIITWIDRDKSIKIRWRDEKNNRKEKNINDFEPYFFIRSTDKRPETYKTRHYIGQGKSIKQTGFFKYKTGNYYNLNKESLTKVFYSHPKDAKNARKVFAATWEGDVPILRRYCVDELKTVPEYELRKWYWDMEWLPDEHEHGGAITAISVYDNYTNKIKLYWWSHWHDKSNQIMRRFNSEKAMLECFVKDMQKQDPDMLIAWWGLQSDVPKLIQRLFENGIDPRGLSPYKEVKGVGFNHIGKLEYSGIEQPIRGRLCLNLDLAFERQWMDAQRGTLPSTSLEYCASVSVGEGKKKESKFTDRNEFFMKAWEEDTTNYLEYCMQDSELLYRIDEEMGLSEGVLAIQKLVKAPFEDCFFVSHMGSTYFMRNAWWKAPTGEYAEKKEYDGALIYNPLDEGTNGLHTNVAAFDFASLYPSCILARNISWETKSETETEFAVNIRTPRDFSDCIQEDWKYYKTDELGLLPNAIATLKPLRKEYKAKMLEALKSENKKDYIKWNSMQMATKRLLASFYGVVALQGFGWYDVDLAASITASAREAIREAAFKVREIGEEVAA